MEDRLTTQKYWEKYYKHGHADRKHIITVCSKYDDYWDLLFKNGSEDKSLIEIGGYPGRYLAYLADKYKVNPTCLDFNSDAGQIKNTFEAMGITNFELIQRDFLKFYPEIKYDFLISMGFIEHFENFDEVLDKHVDCLKPGGRMLISVPNMRYLKKYYAYLCDYQNLKAHNLKCMSINIFKNFAERNRLKVLTLQYFGPFPFGVHQKLNLAQKILFKTTRFIFKKNINPYLMKHPSKYLSSSIIGVYEKPLNK